MKKALAFLTATMMMASMPAALADVTISAENEFPVVSEPITLTAWTQEVVGNDYTTSLMTTYLEDKTGVHLDWRIIGSAEDINTAFNLSIASGDLPDMYLRWFTTSDVTMCIEGNVLLPLNDLIETQGYNYRKMLEEQPQYKDMLTAPDGNIYTFVYTDTGVHKDSEYKMWVKQSWLDTLGMAMPTTPAEFKDLLIAIRDNDVNGNGDTTDEIPMVGYYNGRKTDPICFLMNPFELYNANYYTITDDGKINFLANTDGWREGLAYIADLYSEGLIDEQTYVQDGTQFKSLLNRASDDAIVGTFPCWYQGAEIDSSVLNWQDYVAVAPLKGETGLQQSAARKGGNFNLSFAITNACEYPEAAFKMMDYMLSDEGNILSQFGVEGQSYEWVDEENYNNTTPAIKSFPVESGVSAVWNSGTAPRYDKASVRYATVKDDSIQNVDNTYVLKSAADAYSPYYVWHNIPDVVWCADNDIVTEKSDSQTMFNDYIQMMDTQFVMGELDINNDDEWNAYIEELNNMGLERYIECLTTYYGLN